MAGAPRRGRPRAFARDATNMSAPDGDVLLSGGFEALRPSTAQAEHDRIACWLHDGVLQVLEHLAAGNRGSATCGGCDELRHHAGLAAAELRAFIGTLVRAAPEFEEHLHDEVATAVSRSRHDADHEIELVFGATDGSLPGRRVEVLVSALREALTNARKHARARRVLVYCEESKGRALVRVADDGVGATTGELLRGFGVRLSIIGRMQGAGGWVRLNAPAGHGLVVTLGFGSPGLPL